MSKITLTSLVNLQNETTAVNAINNNNAVLTTALDNTLSRDGTQPNKMGSSLDMNSNRILNLPPPASITDPLRLQDITNLNVSGVLQIPNNTIAGNFSGAAAIPSGTTVSGTGNVVLSTSPTIATPTISSPTISSPVFTGSVISVPTAAPGTTTTQVANTAFVAAAVIAGGGGGGGSAATTQYGTVALATAATIPSAVTAISTLGFYTQGDDGGANYYKIGGAPGTVTSAYIHSADGAWWQIGQNFKQYSLKQFGAFGDGSTDDTVAIQTAINNTPAGGTLYIPPSWIINGTGQYIGGFLFSSTLTVDHPINIKGTGMFSNLKTAVGFTNTSNILLSQNGNMWQGIIWQDFAIGNDSFAFPYTRYGGRGIEVNAVSIPELRFIGLFIGESSNNYSFTINGAGTQACIWDRCKISGGLFLNAVADSHIIQNCLLGGVSTFGVLINTPGAGGFQLRGNTITCVGGAILQSGSGSVITDNYMEELVGHPVNNSAIIGLNAMLACTGGAAAMQGTVIRGNLINMGQGPAGSYCIYNASAASKTTITENVFNNSNNGNTGSIFNTSTSLIGGPNTYNQSNHVVGGGSYFLNYGLN